MFLPYTTPAYHQPNPPPARLPACLPACGGELFLLMQKPEQKGVNYPNAGTCFRPEYKSMVKHIETHQIIDIIAFVAEGPGFTASRWLF